MRLAIIGASDEAIHTIECAKELGIETVALDGNPEAAGLKAADIPLVVDITNENATIDILKELGTDWVQTVPIGRYLTTTGAVNDALGLPGITKEMAVLCTDKYAFHNALSSEGLRNCRCALVRNGEIEHISDVHDIMSYPVILKPRYGSGSRGIMVADNVTELSAILEDMKDVDEDYIIEECLDGDEYGVDAVVIKGKLQLVLIRYKINTPLPDRQAVAYISVDTNDIVHKNISEYLTKVVDVVGLDECIMHADILDTDRGVFAIEISARPSGHNLHNLFTPIATGVDMAKEYMRYRMGEAYSFNPAYTKNVMIHFFDMEGIAGTVPDKATVERKATEAGTKLLEWNCAIRPGDDLGRVSNGHSLMNRGYYIIEGTYTDRDTYRKVADMISGLFEVK